MTTADCMPYKQTRLEIQRTKNTNTPVKMLLYVLRKWNETESEMYVTSTPLSHCCVLTL